MRNCVTKIVKAFEQCTRHCLFTKCGSNLVPALLDYVNQFVELGVVEQTRRNGSNTPCRTLLRFDFLTLLPFHQLIGRSYGGEPVKTVLLTEDKR